MLFVFASSTIVAQDDKKFHFGLKASPGIFWIKTTDKKIANNGGKFGFGYGLILEFAISENYAFATGLDVAGTGAKYTLDSALTTTSNVTKKYDSKYQYVQIPLMLKMKTKDINGMKYFGQFGLNAGVNYKSISDWSRTASGITVERNGDDVKSITFPIRLALAVGAGFEYNLSGSTSALVSVHYDNGFLNINKKDYGTLYSKGVVLTVGILF